jgi:hypothetical protein
MESESVVKALSTQKSPGPDDFTDELYQASKNKECWSSPNSSKNLKIKELFQTHVMRLTLP